MAKTLIGNIKGKDGRGISGIEKTATTGVVDTYTITYTDGTTSTYDVKNSDEVAIQRQIVPSAAVESSTTASQAYAAGDYVVVGGVLRKVTSSITNGSTIGDSNSVVTTVTGEVSKASAYSFNRLTLGSAMNGGDVYCERLGRLVLLHLNAVKFATSHSEAENHDVVVCTGVPVPINDSPVYMIMSISSEEVRVVVSSTGSVTMHWASATGGVGYNGLIAYVALS